MSSETTNRLHCSFCGKGQDDVRKLIAGPSVYICNECVSLCGEILDEELLAQLDTMLSDGLLAPRALKGFLDKYVIGQEFAKKVLAVAVHNHYKRIQAPKARDVTLEKSNILLIGPTGSGKTLLAQSLARTLDVPFTIVDATSLTEAGYVGEDVENIIVSLLQAAELDVARCERGIIYVDEIDKLSRKSENPSITKDVSGEGVQQALLKIIEGTVAHIPPKGGRKHPQQELLSVDTTNILFICGGAFSGLDAIVRKRLGERQMGFATSGSEGAEGEEITDDTDLLALLEPEDLLKFGVIPELIGRLPVLATLEELDEASLIRVLTEPRNALIRQYVKLFEMDGVTLRFEDEALVAVARAAKKQKCGARGLRSILEQAMIQIMYDTPDDETITEIVITAAVITDGAPPQLVHSRRVESA